MRKRIALAVLLSAALMDGRVAGQSSQVTVSEARSRVTVISARFRGMIYFVSQGHIGVIGGSSPAGR